MGEDPRETTTDVNRGGANPLRIAMSDLLREQRRPQASVFEDAMTRVWVRFTLAAVTGVVWALAFPLAGIAGLAWIVPGSLLFLGAGIPTGLAFRTAYVAGCVHYFVSLSWLRFNPFPAGAYTGWVALSFFLALFPATWVWLCWRTGERIGVVPARAFGWSEFGTHLKQASWWSLNLWFLACGACWVGWEMALARIFGGFPWNLLGVSQYRLTPLIQISSVTGVYGVSFLIVWFSVSLLTSVVLLLRFPDQTAAWRRPLLFSSLIMVAVTGSGFLSILQDRPATRRISVALVQPSIPQTMIFDPDATTQRYDALVALTERALATKPDLVIWPEASLPGGLGKEQLERLLQTLRGAGAWMVLGADESEEISGTGPDPRIRSFNSAFLLNPAGEIVAAYRKRRLVMFGEYIPFGKWLPFLQHLAPIGDGFEAGTEPKAFRLDTLGVVTSVLICFEDNFPQQAREHATAGVDFLLNLTNDAWFGRSSAQWQHAANACFRAIENGIPLVRCANNGISCWIDPRGRLHSPRFLEGRDVYDAGFDTISLPLQHSGRTVYNRVGDVFGWMCMTVAALSLGDFFRRSRGSRPQEKTASGSASKSRPPGSAKR